MGNGNTGANRVGNSARWRRRAILSFAGLGLCSHEAAFAASTAGATGDAKPDFVYDAVTGDLTFITDGAVFKNTTGASSFVDGFNVVSRDNLLNPAGLTPPFLAGIGLTATSGRCASALTNSPGFADGISHTSFDLGNILPTGLQLADLVPELTLNYGILNNGGVLRVPGIIVGRSVAQSFDTYTGPSGNWSGGTNWSLTFSPGLTNTAVLSAVSGSVAVNFDPASAMIESLTLTASGSNSITLNHNQGTLTTLGGEVVGDAGLATLNLTGGNHSVGAFVLGSGNAPANAIFNISGGKVSSATDFTLGGTPNVALDPNAPLVNSTLNASGNGSVGATTLYMALNSAFTATFNISGSAAATFTTANVGVNGLASINQSGGSFGVSGALTLGQNSTGVGNYSLTNGLFSSGPLTIGAGGSGTFSQSGGTASCTSAIIGNAGLLTFSGGKLTASGTVTVNGTFNESAGTATLGSLTQSLSGTTTLSGGSLNITGLSTINGLFSQGSGSATLGSLNVASSGTVSLTGGIFSVNGAATIDGTLSQPNRSVSYGSVMIDPSGTLLASGGTVTVNTSLAVNGVYTHNNGSVSASSLLVGSSGTMGVSESSVSISGTSAVNGLYTQAGGVASTSSLLIGSTGTMSLSGVALTAGGATTVNGTLSDSSQFVSLGTLIVGSSGLVTLTGGTLALSGTSTINGSLTHSGGVVTSSASKQMTIGTSGTLSLSADTFSAGPLTLSGKFSQSGGSATLASLSGNASGTVSLSGVNLSVLTPSSLAGAFTQDGGASSFYNLALRGGTITVTSGSLAFQQPAFGLPSLSGTGSVSIGGGTAATTASANGLAITALNVASNATIALPATNSVLALTISGGGKLDLGGSLLVDRSATPLSLVQGYVQSGNNSGTWAGPGIQSSFIKAHSSTYTMAVIDGAGNLTGLSQRPAANQILVTPALIGDATLSGAVNEVSIRQIISRGHYNDGTTNNTWADGDFTGDGKVDSNDIQALTLSGNFHRGTNYAINKPLAGIAGDGRPDIVYDPLTGDIQLKADGVSGISEYNLIDSSFRLIATNVTQFGGPFDLKSSFELDGFLLGSSFANVVDLGTILPTGLNFATLQNELGLGYTANGMPSNSGDVIVTPEPTTLCLLGIAVGGLLARRRRKIPSEPKA